MNLCPRRPSCGKRGMRAWRYPCVGWEGRESSSCIKQRGGPGRQHYTLTTASRCTHRGLNIPRVYRCPFCMTAAHLHPGRCPVSAQRPWVSAMPLFLPLLLICHTASFALARNQTMGASLQHGYKCGISVGKKRWIGRDVRPLVSCITRVHRLRTAPPSPSHRPLPMHAPLY